LPGTPAAAHFLNVTARTLARLPPILLVEDDDKDLYLMRRAFSATHVENTLLVALDGEDAIQLLTVNDGCRIPRPGLLITDLKMPKVDGFELLLWLQTQPQLKSMPKLVVSSSALEEDLAKSLRLGATAYFIKPTTYAGLLELVSVWKTTLFENTPAAVKAG
jgi:CheY-like chemotaxis protein